MKRELRFRAWDGKQMHYPKEHTYVVRFDGVVGQFHEKMKSYTSVDWEIMQMIDWKDVAGKQIWEGDIIRYDLEPDASKGYPARYNLTRVVKVFATGAIGGWDTNIRVIGNIYETPTLIPQ